MNYYEKYYREMAIKIIEDSTYLQQEKILTAFYRCLSHGNIHGYTPCKSCFISHEISSLPFIVGVDLAAEKSSCMYLNKSKVIRKIINERIIDLAEYITEKHSRKEEV